MAVSVVGDGVPVAVVGAERHNTQAKPQVGYLFPSICSLDSHVLRTDYTFTLLPVDHLNITSQQQTSW
jgi:hypothetical protein